VEKKVFCFLQVEMAEICEVTTNIFCPEIDHIMDVLDVSIASRMALKAFGLSLPTLAFVREEDMLGAEVPCITGRALLDHLHRLSHRSHPAKDASLFENHRRAATGRRFSPRVDDVEGEPRIFQRKPRKSPSAMRFSELADESSSDEESRRPEIIIFRGPDGTKKFCALDRAGASSSVQLPIEEDPENAQVKRDIIDAGIAIDLCTIVYR